MKRIFSASAAALLAAASADVATAQPPRPGDDGPRIERREREEDRGGRDREWRGPGPGRPAGGPDRRDDHGPEGRPGFRPPMSPVIRAIDKDRDGTLSEDEIRGAAEALESLDRNDDGELTPRELSPGFPPRGPWDAARHPRLERRDGNDGPDGPDGPGGPLRPGSGPRDGRDRDHAFRSRPDDSDEGRHGHGAGEGRR